MAKKRSKAKRKPRAPRSEREARQHQNVATPIYSPEVVDRICERLADGVSLITICKDEAMPSKSTVMKWLADKDPQYDDLRAKYKIAREIQELHIYEELKDIADDSSNDYMERTLKNGDTVLALNIENVHRSRLRVDTRKFLLRVMNPKKYGDRVVNELTGKDGGPIQTEDVGLTRDDAINGILEKLRRNGVRVISDPAD
jgi:hypothetical protein